MRHKVNNWINVRERKIHAHQDHYEMNQLCVGPALKLMLGLHVSVFITFLLSDRCSVISVAAG